MIKNFRELSKYNPKINFGILYRTASLSDYVKHPDFQECLQRCNIHTIIDLRADREVKISPYHTKDLKQVTRHHIPFDPWNQPTVFQRQNTQGTNVHKAYRFFVQACKAEIKQVCQVILSQQNGAIAIHCVHGKDRAGIIVSLLHLLSGADEAIVYKDYLASRMDTKKEYIDILLNEVKRQRGIIQYLKNCELTTNEILNLQKQLQK